MICWDEADEHRDRLTDEQRDMVSERIMVCLHRLAVTHVQSARLVHTLNCIGKSCAGLPSAGCACFSLRLSKTYLSHVDVLVVARRDGIACSKERVIEGGGQTKELIHDGSLRWQQEWRVIEGPKKQCSIHPQVLSTATHGARNQAMLDVVHKRRQAHRG